MRRRELLTAGTTLTAALTVPGLTPAQAASATAGRVTQNLRMPSRILGTDVLYSLYLPRGHRSGRRYPVLYLLHGATGDNTEWLREGNARRILDEAIARRRIPPIVVVMPDGRRDPSKPSADQPLGYFMNDARGPFQWADMFTRELVPYVESRHRAGGSAGRRAIGGLSMGGFGALSFAMRAPGTFTAAVGLSAGVRTDEQHIALSMDDYNWRFAGAFGADLSGRERLNDLYRHWNLLDLINRTPAATLSRTAYYLDCGSYDQFFEGNADLHIALTRTKVPHRFMAREGVHEWAYWRSGLPAALDFLADHLS